MRRYDGANCTGTYTTVGIKLPENQTTFTDYSATPGTTYYYQVLAKNDCLFSQPTAGTNSCSGGVKDLIGVVPSGFSNNSAADLNGCTDTGVLITWQADPIEWGNDLTGTRYYDVYRGSTLIASNLSYGTTSFIDTGGTNNTYYTYQVKYKNGCNLTATTTGTMAMDNVASSPSGIPIITAMDVNGCTDTGVRIAWPADPGNWNDGGTGTRYYNVYRAGTLISSNLSYGTTSYIDTGGTNNTNYAYFVLYVNGCNYSSFSSGATAMDHVVDWPSGFANISAADINACQDTGVFINWQADAGDWGDGGTGTRYYNVYRGATVIASHLLYGTTSYIDTAGSNNTNYTYYVEYVNGCNYSNAPAGATAMDHIPSVPTGLSNITVSDIDACADTGVLLAWQADAGNWGDGGSGTRHYDIFRGGTLIASNLAYGTTSFIDTAGSNNTTYTYFVQYVNGCDFGNTPPGAGAMDHVSEDPSGFANNTAADLNACQDTGVRITWQADPSNWGDGGIGTRYYHVWRNGIMIASYLSYGTTSYIDATGVNGTSYQYNVSYQNGCGAFGTTDPGAYAADTVDTTPCPSIGNTLKLTKSGTNAVMNWSAVACADLMSYIVFASTTYNAPFPSSWTILGNPVPTTWNVPLGSSYIAFKTLSVDSCSNLSPN